MLRRFVLLWLLACAAVVGRSLQTYRGGPYPKINIWIQQELDSNLTLDCTVPRYLKAISNAVVWYKDGVRISRLRQDDRILDDGSFKLHILNIQCSDQGNYTCKLFDENVPIAMIDYQLQVNNKTGNTVCITQHKAPAILVKRPHSSDVLQPEFSTLELVCIADGTPYPTFTWLKDGVDISSSQIPGPSIQTAMTVTKKGSAIAVKSVLGIEELRVSHNGEYQCRATNSQGNATEIFRVEAVGRMIPEPPALLPGYPSSTNCTKGETVFLTCRAQSETPLALTWFRVRENVQHNMSGQEFMLLAYLASDDPARFNGFFLQTLQSRVDRLTGNIWQSELEIVNCSDHDSGYYTCLAQNVFDISYMTVQLVVHEPYQDNYFWLIIVLTILPMCCFALWSLQLILLGVSRRGFESQQ